MSPVFSPSSPADPDHGTAPALTLAARRRVARYGRGVEAHQDAAPHARRQDVGEGAGHAVEGDLAGHQVVEVGRTEVGGESRPHLRAAASIGVRTESTPSRATPRVMNEYTVVCRSVPPVRPLAATAAP